MALPLGPSKRRAQRGGRFVDGNTQVVFARRQFEQGDCLSHRTLRVRHMMQLRGFDAGTGDGDVPVDAASFAHFSELEAEAAAIMPPQL